MTINTKEIERKFKLKPVDRNTVSFLNSRGRKMCNNEEEVEQLLKSLKAQAKFSHNIFIDILGYDLFDNGEKVCIYYNTHVSNS